MGNWDLGQLLPVHKQGQSHCNALLFVRQQSAFARGRAVGRPQGSSMDHCKRYWGKIDDVAFQRLGLLD